jgi:hypothetical protein
MAGTLTISTLNNDTGPLATQNGMTGIAKAWVNFNGSGGAIRASFNVSSITVNGTGDYTVNFTTALTDANYSVVGMSGQAAADAQPIVMSQHTDTVTSSACRVGTRSTTAKVNSTYNNVAVFD